MSQAIDPIDIEARLRVRYPDFNWTVGEARAGTWLHITGNMPSRSLTEVITIEPNLHFSNNPIQAGDRVVNALLQRVGLNAEVRVAERILRRYYSNVTVHQNADGSMEIEINPGSGASRSYHVNSVEGIGDIISNAIVLVHASNQSSTINYLPTSPSPPPAQEYRCVTSVMLDRSVTL